MTGPLRIFAFAGSLRKQSFNKMALHAAKELAPSTLDIEIHDIAGIPLFNQDEEDPAPQLVEHLREAVRAADGVLIATPEYNYSVPGVLKNVIDWGSRPYGKAAWQTKPVGLIGASIGNLGSARAQYHLRQSLGAVNMYVMSQPEVMIPFASQKFDDSGNLTDEKTREILSGYMAAYAEWVGKFK